jgi:hypothetical protein
MQNIENVLGYSPVSSPPFSNVGPQLVLKHIAKKNTGRVSQWMKRTFEKTLPMHMQNSKACSHVIPNAAQFTVLPTTVMVCELTRK